MNMAQRTKEKGLYCIFLLYFGNYPLECTLALELVWNWYILIKKDWRTGSLCILNSSCVQIDALIATESRPEY